MRTAFEHLVDALADDTVRFEKGMRATGRDNPETATDEIARHVEQAFLVGVTYRKKRVAAARYDDAGRLMRTRKRRAETAAHAHDLSLIHISEPTRQAEI